MELKGLDLIKAYRDHPDAFLPMIDIRKEVPRVKVYEDGYREYNIGWNAGILEGNRPFLAMCWAAESMTTLSLYVSSKGIENITAEELEQMFLDYGYYSYREGNRYSPDIREFSDPHGNRFFLLTVAVGIPAQPGVVPPLIRRGRLSCRKHRF